MRLDLTVYGVLMVAGLGTAYWASLPATEGDEEKVKIVSLASKEIVEVRLVTKDVATGGSVEATATRRDGDERYWFEHSKTEIVKAPPPNPHADAKDPKPSEPAAPTPKVTVEQFLGNEKMDEFVKSFDPFVAMRVIGKVNEAQLEEFGLKEPSGELTITASGGKTVAFKLGKKSYGTRSRFVQETGEGSQGRVLLIEDEAFENFERAPLRLYDRRLVPFEVADVTAAAVSSNGAAKRLAHTQRDKGGELLWTDDEENAPAKPAFDAWMDKVAKLRLMSYAKPEDETALANTKPFMEIAFEKDGKVLDVVRFKKLSGDKPTYWVTSDFLKMHGQLVPARFEPIEKDAASILAGTKS